MEKVSRMRRAARKFLVEEFGRGKVEGLEVETNGQELNVEDSMFQSPSLEVFEKCVGAELSSMVW